MIRESIGVTNASSRNQLDYGKENLNLVTADVSDFYNLFKGIISDHQKSETFQLQYVKRNVIFFEKIVNIYINTKALVI